MRRPKQDRGGPEVSDLLGVVHLAKVIEIHWSYEDEPDLIISCHDGLAIPTKTHGFLHEYRATKSLDRLLHWIACLRERPGSTLSHRLVIMRGLNISRVWYSRYLENGSRF